MRAVFEILAHLLTLFFYLRGFLPCRRPTLTPGKQARITELERGISQKFNVELGDENLRYSRVIDGLVLGSGASSIFKFAGPRDTLDSVITLLDVRDCISETLFMHPGCELRSKGYIACGSTGCGDIFCLDTKNTDEDGWPQIVILSHEGSYRFKKRASIERVAKVVAKDYLEFVERFLEDSVDDLCFYSSDVD